MRFGLLLAFIVFLSSCAHAPPTREDPQAALRDVCAIGGSVRAVQGSIWMNASSRDASGRFPAQVRAIAASKVAPSSLKMEATNLLGGVEAVITVEGKKYAVEVPGHPERAQRGTSSWAGIPLEWATDLFLGKVPCPEGVALSDAKPTLSKDGELVVQARPTLSGDSQRFVYQLRFFGTRAWPEQLHWEKQGFAPTAVDFRFSDPEDHTYSPSRWEAKSKNGEVKVRWKDREVH